MHVAPWVGKSIKETSIGYEGVTAFPIQLSEFPHGMWHLARKTVSCPGSQYENMEKKKSNYSSSASYEELYHRAFSYAE